MPETDLLRASRDGDQFHYQWAARESLKLLRPGSDLKAIAVEGVSATDTDENDGEEVVDLAEYYGSEDLRAATRVAYRQLKHSTYQTEVEWTVSGLKKTVQGFAAKFRRIREEAPGSEEKVTFEFVTNRTVRHSVFQAIEALSSDATPPPDTNDVRFLRTYAGFGPDRSAEAAFFAGFRVVHNSPSLVLLTMQVKRAVTGILPGASDVHHLMLKEMIARRATSLEPDGTVRRDTVLAALGTSEIDLLPAPNLIRTPVPLVVTDQIPVIAEAVVAAGSEPVIVHAAGGVGKSALTTQLGQYLPTGSLTFVYDCFGDGEYRRGSRPRHQHQQGIVQMSNELAAHLLTDPLIPVTTAHPSQYLRVFLARLESAADELTARCPDALLTIVVDAADNAAMFAKDRGEQAFVTDLLRENLPPGTRLVMLCRTERVELLAPPPRAHQLELAGFSLDNSASHVRATFPDATDEQVAEFHRRTGSNPRVQAFVLEGATDLDECLASLGEARHADGSLLDELIGRRLAQFKDLDRPMAAGVDRVCEALAALRPRIPVRVLSALCSVSDSLIHSLVADLGRPLLIDGDALQFRDEPTETWFRIHHRPSGADLTAFIDRLLPFANEDAYVAASLPELMWEAGQVEELVELALSDEALPQNNDLEEREVAQQRVQYALKASLRAGREFEATRLALKAGTLAAGHSRTLRLLRRNTDLAGRFLDLRVIEDLVATRSLIGEWPGSNLQYEGALLSSTPAQIDLARSRLRSAVDWMREWVRQPHEGGHGVSTEDIAELAFGLLNVNGAAACVEFLAAWTPKRVAFQAGLIVADRLADAGRVEELDQLGFSAKGVKYLQYAVACAAWKANFVCSARTARRMVKVLKRQRRPVSFRRKHAVDEQYDIQVVTWIIAMGLRHGVLRVDEAERILTLSLPDKIDPMSNWHGPPPEPLLCGFALLSLVRRRPFLIDEFASEKVAEAMKRSAYQQPRELSTHREQLTPLADWALTWMTCLTGSIIELDTRFQQLADATLKNYPEYETPRLLIRGIFRLAGKIAAFGLSQENQQRIIAWCRQHERYLPTGALIDIVRATAAGDDTARVAYATAQLIRDAWDNAHVDADEKADGMVALARAIFRVDPAEAAEHFAHARDLTDRVGDDVIARWEVLLALANAASSSERADQRRAYRVAQIVEGLEPYFGDAIDHEKALTAIGHLSTAAAVSVASRWRDRRFCSEWSLVRAASTQGNPLAPAPQTALAMLPFSAGIPTADLLEQAFHADPENAAAVASVVGEFLSHTGVSQHLISRLGNVADELGIDLQGTPLATDAATVAEQPTVPVTTSEDWLTTDYGRAQAAKGEQTRKALTQCDLTTAEGWEEARSIITASERVVHFDALADLAIGVRPAELGRTLAAFLTNPHFTEYDYATLINRLSDVEVMPQAALAQIRNLARDAATRFCRELTLKNYTILDLRQLAELAQLTDDLTGTALRQLGAHPSALDAIECFTLAATLARRLPPAQAQVALDDFTQLSLHVAPLDFGDGDFASLHAAPDSLSQCLAGWLWVALGDPEIEMRWRAAHCVRLLVDLQCMDELRALHDFAMGTLSHNAFTDARLPFYDKHASQWLLLALARAVQNPDAHDGALLFVPLLKRVLFQDPPHVVMQSAARATLLALAEAGPNVLTAQQKTDCEGIGSSVGTVPTNWSDRIKSRSRRRDRDDSTTNAASTFRFFMDFKDYWCEPLGEAFNLSSDDVESRAINVAVNRWKISAEGIPDDPRRGIGPYQNKRNYPHKSEWPEIDNNRFYTAVHALWTVAGDLVASYPALHDEEDEQDLFSSWIRRFIPGRIDGRWLADRRDPAPASVFAGKDQSVGPEWIWRLCARDFTQLLLDDDNWVTVREYRHETTYGASQEAQIHSALVSPDRARALAIALQIAPSYRAFRLPDADDHDSQYNESGFELAGWLVHPHSREGSDSYDPLADGVKYPPAHPSEDMIDLLGLTSDADMRIWKRTGSTVLRSAVWDDTGGGREHGPDGHRLQMRRDELHKMLQQTEKSMVIVVMIDRRHERMKQSFTPATEHDDDDTLPILEPSFKVFLFDGGGRCEEL